MAETWFTVKFKSFGVFSTLALHFQPLLQCSSKEMTLLWIKNVNATLHYEVVSVLADQDRNHLSETTGLNWVFKVVRIIKPIFLCLLMDHMLPKGKATKLWPMKCFFPGDGSIVWGCSNHIDVCLSFGLSVFIIFFYSVNREWMVVIDSWFLPLIGQAGGWSQIWV